MGGAYHFSVLWKRIQLKRANQGRLSGRDRFNSSVQFSIHVLEVLVALRWKLFAGSTIEARLESAYESFHAWSVGMKQKSSLNKFELKTFKMTSCAGSYGLSLLCTAAKYFHDGHFPSKAPAVSRWMWQSIRHYFAL